MISKVPARPSAGIGVVEVQKLEFLHLDHADSRRGLREHRRNRKKPSFCTSTTPIPAEGCASTAEGFLRLLWFRTGPRELSRGSRACSRNRRVAGSIPPWSAGGRRKMQLAF